MKILATISFACLMLLARGAWVPQSPPYCYTYICDPSNVNWNAGDCGTEDPADNNTYYFRSGECTGSEVCSYNGNTDFNYTCQAPIQQVTTVYPGEICDDQHICISGSNCTNSICLDILPCQNQFSCGGPYYCNQNSGECVELGTSGQACYNDNYCAQGYGCDHEKCVAFLSVSPGGSVQQCNDRTSFSVGVNYLCESTLCYYNSTSSEYYCAGATTSLSTPPTTCYSSDDCMALTDPLTNITYTSTCACGYTKNATAYCGLFPGDSDYQIFLNNWKAWLGSLAATKCNSARSKPVNPLENWCGLAASNSSSNWERVAFSIVKATQYPSIINAQDCILKIINPQVEEEEDDDSGAMAFLISAVVLSVFY